VHGLKTIVRAVQEDHDSLLDAVTQLSRSRRIFAPLAFMVGAFALLLEGVKVILTNWRLMLIQVLPAMWVWLAMFDLKAHVLHGRSHDMIRGPILIPLGLAIVALTAASFFLNAVFAFAISAGRPPRIRPAFAQARQHIGTIFVWGVLVGAPLAVATTISPRWGRPWFAVTLGTVVGVMMVCYVAVPSRLIGVTPTQSRRDKLTASALSSILGTTVCTPPYILARVGILMLGSRALVIPGVLLLTVGATLQAGATGTVRAVKLSTRLAAGGSTEPVE
jgi:hypothetical protein